MGMSSRIRLWEKTRKWLALAIISGAVLSVADPGAWATLQAPLPTNAYISENGYDWAWAFPLPASYGLDLSYQSSFGWRIPTAQELTFAPLATDFLFAGGNVPFNGRDPVSGASFAAVNSASISAQSAGAVATPYFSSSFFHADWQDGLGQPDGPWAGMAGAPPSWGDQLVIRASSVPEPATWSLLVLGFVALLGGWRLRRRS